MNAEIFVGLHVFNRRQFILNKRNPPIDMKSIADVIKYTVCNQMDQDVKDVESHCRKREMTAARHVCMYFISGKTNLSLKNIGRMFGNRHYSTVICAKDAVNDMMDTDRKFKAQILAIDKLLETEINTFQNNDKN